jgi:hypothetical protein
MWKKLIDRLRGVPVKKVPPVQFKRGVWTHRDNHTVSHQILKAIGVAAAIYRRHDRVLTVTSLMDGKHMEGSKHYTGHAADLRTRNLISPRVVADELAHALGPDYDVVLEKDHIHMEYDPK